MNETSNPNELGKHCKRSQNKTFDLVCISFETLGTSCKITNHPEIGESDSKLKGQNFNIIG